MFHNCFDCSVCGEYSVDILVCEADALSMMNSADNRIDPSRLSPEELDRLAEMVIEEERPALVGREGVRLELPDPIFHLLVRVIRTMREGRAIVLLPEDETSTTQAVANYLGMSRQFFVNLLESGQIPFHRVGAHRRVYFKDLLDFQKKRDKERREALNKLFNAVEEAGHYDKTLPAEDEKG
jgi:excisionase family DNA binding protein